MQRAKDLPELQAVLTKYGWTKDESSSTDNNQLYLPPKSLRTITPGISLMRDSRGGFWYWNTLDFESSDVTEVGPEKLEDFLRFRQPDVA